MAAKGPMNLNDPGLQTNMDVDYVISYRFATTGTHLFTCSLINCFDTDI